MSEQWTGDWMRDAETGQLIDGPTLNRHQMFMLIRELRAVIAAHAQTIREKQAVIDDSHEENGKLGAALRALSSDCLRWIGTSSFPVLCRPRSASHKLALEAIAETESKP